MAAALGFPFTWTQRKELERQAMIYKYMVASLPVPPHLLIPITQHSSFSNLKLRFSNSKDEAEPGRCKRTDGKKWRCSRDVAPHHKYCERHLHRGRPRSRKPVEVQPHFNNKKTRLDDHRTVLPSPEIIGSRNQSNETTLFHYKIDENFSVSSYHEPNRGFDWATEGEMLKVDDSEQQWKNLLQTNLIPETGFCASETDQQNEECDLFLNPGLVCSEKHHQVAIPTRGFIDAWSNESSVSSKNLSPSSLALSMAMAAGDALDFEMGLGTDPGGPLAEMLRPSSASSFPCSGRSVSTSMTPEVMPFPWLD